MKPNVYEVFKPTQTSDGMGGYDTVFESHTKINGWIDLISGTDKNMVQNAQTQDSTHILVTELFYSDVTDKMKIVHDGVDYQITFVDNPVSVNHHLEIYLKVSG